MAEAGAASLVDADGQEGRRGRANSGVLRVSAVGVSTSATCGVRDHAALLAEALAGEQIQCSLHWLGREERALGPARREMRRWATALTAELMHEQPGALLLHYSVFTCSYRGVPLFVAPLLAALRRSRTPLVTLLHEYAYPWRHGGLRGDAWALTQRAALRRVVRATSAAIVTSEARAEWLRSRAWLPSRPISVAPVFSNLPLSRAAARADGAPARVDGAAATVGLFGYSYEGIPIALVLDALERLRDRGIDAQLLLLGAPGAGSPPGRAWLDAARERSAARAPAFSGELPADALSDALAGCDVLLFADRAGPTSRKTTLAASLASGVPVVAIDGPQTWRALAQDGAAAIAPSTAEGVADALAALLADPGARAALGSRGREFAAREMSARRSAQVAAAALRRVAAEPRGDRPGEP